VDGSAVTQPVSGTVTANQGGAPWTVKPDSSVWTLTGTSANVNITNTVGVSCANCSGTVTTSDSHYPAAAALSDALSNPTTTEIGANVLGWDATNSVWRRVQVDAGTGTVKVDGSGATQPVSCSNCSGTVTANQGTANATPWNENVAQFGGTNVSTGTGASGTGIPRVTVANDSFSASATIQTTVGYSTTSQTLLASSTIRQGYYIVNNASTPLCLTHGTTSNLNNGVAFVPPGGGPDHDLEFSLAGSGDGGDGTGLDVVLQLRDDHRDAV
jgi:hypothetical protein